MLDVSSAEFPELRAAAVAIEARVLRELGFCLFVEHPHRLLAPVAEALNGFCAAPTQYVVVPPKGTPDTLRRDAGGDAVGTLKRGEKVRAQRMAGGVARCDDGTVVQLSHLRMASVMRTVPVTRPDDGRGLLGLTFLSDSMIVTNVAASGPAAKAGVEPGMRIACVGGVGVSCGAEYRARLETLPPGSVVELLLERVSSVLRSAAEQEAEGTDDAAEATRRLVSKAWVLVSDSLRTTLACRFPASTIACAAIYLAARMDQRPQPTSWWRVLGVTDEDVVDACSTMAELYQAPRARYRALARAGGLTLPAHLAPVSLDADVTAERRNRRTRSSSSSRGSSSSSSSSAANRRRRSRSRRRRETDGRRRRRDDRRRRSRSRGKTRRGGGHRPATRDRRHREERRRRDSPRRRQRSPRKSDHQTERASVGDAAVVTPDVVQQRLDALRRKVAGGRAAGLC
eukprot:TRINITY_DN8862_c0_g2_i2.p1 TRINITY_DN8862_c0_g2~~TRINITY_DN8862_c0_g2_i2.p1  ORF type:complete len:456 (+),score=132.67 TRINITY_DN8862_c0_g2_i2:1-1368(+)